MTAVFACIRREPLYREHSLSRDDDIPSLFLDFAEEDSAVPYQPCILPSFLRREPLVSLLAMSLKEMKEELLDSLQEEKDQPAADMEDLSQDVRPKINLRPWMKLYSSGQSPDKVCSSADGEAANGEAADDKVADDKAAHRSPSPLEQNLMDDAEEHFQDQINSDDDGSMDAKEQLPQPVIDSDDDDEEEEDVLVTEDADGNRIVYIL